MFLNLFLFYQVVRPFGRKSVNKYSITSTSTSNCTCNRLKAQVAQP